MYLLATAFRGNQKRLLCMWITPDDILSWKAAEEIMRKSLLDRVPIMAIEYSVEDAMLLDDVNIFDLEKTYYATRAVSIAAFKEAVDEEWAYRSLVESAYAVVMHKDVMFICSALQLGDQWETMTFPIADCCDEI